MPTYTFTYFHVRSRGETPRMLFKLADQPFEDIRVNAEDPGWPALKKKLPNGQVPMLEVDGVQLVQGQAISRFLAKRFGFAGNTDVEAARIDMVADCVEDLTPRVLPLYELKGEAKTKYAARYRQETLPPSLAHLEKLLEQNNGGNGFFVGGSVTWADLYFYNMSDYVIFMSEAGNIMDKFPKLKALKTRVAALPKIAAWIKERPVTIF